MSSCGHEATLVSCGSAQAFYLCLGGVFPLACLPGSSWSSWRYWLWFHLLRGLFPTSFFPFQASLHSWPLSASYSRSISMTALKTLLCAGVCSRSRAAATDRKISRPSPSASTNITPWLVWSVRLTLLKGCCYSFTCFTFPQSISQNIIAS